MRARHVTSTIKHYSVAWSMSVYFKIGGIEFSLLDYLALVEAFSQAKTLSLSG
ncbi:protein of unknown function [Vibrio tapetis subsp. tapetis]|uniref:Uncharacterized protein n=1 Tax=Vibrio tapetis subsp. tapetis TaxID=1671868 RepID=A0A2N8ZGF0_9VIBR|nr:protein of unknown function [Vibrio tapetis subsp. tapetis]